MPRIVIEIGLNHLGDPERADRLLSAALATTADAVTFQIRESAFYATGDVYRRQLSGDYYSSARARTKAAGKEFGFAVCDVARIPELAAIGTDFWKTLSWDLTNTTLQQALRSTGQTVYVSTGVSALDDIQATLAANSHARPIQTQLTRDTHLVNLAAIRTLREATGRSVSFGLHCPDLEVAFVALAFEPEAVFFYIREESAPFYIDLEHAVPLPGLSDYVARMRRLSAAIGDGVKHPHEKPAWVLTT